MNEKQSERFAEQLLNLDESLLEEAYEVSDAKKLREYTRRQKDSRRARLLPLGRRAALIAACLALAIGASFVAPRLLEDPNRPAYETNPTETNLPQSDEDGMYTIQRIDVIDSIDKLNYYSTMKLLIDPPAASQTSRNAYGGGMRPLSATAPEGAMLLLGTSDEVYSTFNSNDFFSVSLGTFFQIRVTDKNGFLASKVGTGVVDVAITSNDFNPVITLKNGDRYFSCFWNSGNHDRITFSTHKYAVNFDIVKNFDQDNYTMTVIYDENGQAVEFRCSWYDAPGELPPDGSVEVVSETYVFRGNTNVTIEELESFFSTEKQIALERRK